METGRLWQQMAAQPRHSVAALTRDQIPLDPGVYSVWREGSAIYVGKATSLRQRVGGSHLGRSRSIRNSAFRRNVAEHLDIARAHDIYRGTHRLDDEELTRVQAFIGDCELAWIAVATPEAAVELEDAIKVEWMPPLTKR